MHTSAVVRIGSYESLKASGSKKKKKDSDILESPVYFELLHSAGVKDGTPNHTLQEHYKGSRHLKLPTEEHLDILLQKALIQKSFNASVFITADDEEDDGQEKVTAPDFTMVTPSWLNVTQTPHTNQICEESEDFKYLAYKVTYCVVFPIGLISNTVALFVFLSLTKKTSANIVFMTNLAISDVGFSLTLPFRLVYYFRGGQWDFPDWFCRWCVFSFYVNLYTSVLFLTGLSILRYIAIVKSMKHQTLVTPFRAKIACVAIWIFVACLSTPFLLTGTTQRNNKTRCFEPGNNNSWNRIFILNYVGILLGFVIPFIIILVCYSCIICLLKGKNTPRKNKNNKQRSVYLIAIVLSTFLLCFLPYHVIRTVHLHAKVLNESCQVIEFLLKVLVISLCMASFNSCFNPLLYYFAAENFRTDIRNASFRWSYRRQSQNYSQKSNRRSFNSAHEDCSPCSANISDGCKSAELCKLTLKKSKPVHSLASKSKGCMHSMSKTSGIDVSMVKISQFRIGFAVPVEGDTEWSERECKLFI
ncbi:cysteinyl leukotriene receptor 2 [Garra rufa]|uniref:cysteinyl leukotriene receptor 2 n=1 Tax=Garra rufa TaxID=137080 RepID=UPI003CCEDBB7